MDLFDLPLSIQEYIEKKSSPEDKVLTELRRYTFLKAIHPRMISGPIQGKFLEFISNLVNPERILEIGTYTGYSAICLARGLKKSGKLITIEINDELKNIQDSFFHKAGLQDKIDNRTGNALDIIPKLKDQFELIFIDGDKKHYPEYYDLCTPLLKKGGIMIADNVLWDGKVGDPKFDKDQTTLSIREFNNKVCADPEMENVLLPLRDGLMMIRKN